jgi:methylmalonyl-CoA/ethylmalonyl-CoA epimerase
VRLHHVGIVTKKLSECVKLYQALGYSEKKHVYDPLQKASIALMERAGELMIELIAPEHQESPAHKWLDRIKAGTYHICYEVPSLGDATRALRKLGFAIIMDPVPAVAFDHRRVVFLWSALTGLIELVERAE